MLRQVLREKWWDSEEAFFCLHRIYCTIARETGLTNSIVNRVTYKRKFNKMSHCSIFTLACPVFPF